MGDAGLKGIADVVVAYLVSICFSLSLSLSLDICCSLRMP